MLKLSRSPEASRRRSWFRVPPPLIVLTALAVLLGTGWLVPNAASAAGSGVLNLAITPVDLADGSTITDIEEGTHNNRVSYRVQYSCTTAACDATKVKMSTPPADPYGLLPAGQFLLMYDAWVQPGTGGTISGTDATGKTIDLGNLAAGDAGSFTVTYLHQANRNREVPNGSLYRDGFQVSMSATISSDTAVTAVTEQAAPVTWHIGTPAGPSAALTNGTFDTDTDVQLNAMFNGGNMLVGPGANVQGSAKLAAVGSYQVVYHVPPQAEIVSATNPTGDAMIIDNTAHTVTWTKGSTASPAYGARGGWGVTGCSSLNSLGFGIQNGTSDDTKAFWGCRGITLRFPGANFPEADATGCNFTTTVQTSMDVSVTYLDPARTTKTATNQATSKVACTDPFGAMEVEKRVAGGFANQYTEGDGNLGGTGGGVFATNVPAPGEANIERVWQVRVANLGNVPAVATVDEQDLALDHLKVRQITPSGVGATIEWTADDGTGTLTSGTTTVATGVPVNAPTGGWFTKAKAVTTPIAPGRILPTDNTRTNVYLNYRYGVDDGAPIGERRTNTAHISMTYPGYESEIRNLQLNGPLALPLEDDASRTVQYTQPSPILLSAFAAPPVVAGGTLSPGTEVTWKLHGGTNEVWPGTTIRPQIVYIAPVGWKVIPGSAEMDATAPAGVTLDYATRTFSGTPRDVVVATWPSTIAPSTVGQENWPVLTVKSTPTATAPGGVPVTSTVWAGDASGAWNDSVTTGYALDSHQFRGSAGGVVDTPDVDGDGDTVEEFAFNNSAPVTVAASDGLSVVKELCLPDEAAADGCAWVSDPAHVQSVPVATTDVKYRITLTNTGNTTLHNAVAYDVLPHVGDTGLLASPPARGSQFGMSITSVESSTANAALAYSASPNPARPEVNPGAAGTVDDWGTSAASKKALRLRATSNLAPGEQVRVVFLAGVANGAAAGQKACNSVAVDSAETLPAEPLPVCVQLAATAAHPALALDKSAAITTDAGTTGAADAGDVITYTFRATNTGDVPLHDVTIADPKPGLSAIAPATVATLAPGADATFTATYLVTLGDVDGGADITNAATARAQGPDDAAVLSPVDATATPVADAAPSLLLDKEAELHDANGNGKADVGERIGYTFTVRNDGNVTVTGVQVDDPMVTGLAPATATIAPGGSRLFTADDYVVTQADVDNGGPIENRASATGKGPDGGSVTSPEDTTQTPTATRAPALSIDKSAELTTDLGTADVADRGDVITYSFAVRNTGNVTLTQVAVQDALAGLSPTSPLQVATLAPGESTTFTATYAVTQADVDAGVPVHNSAVAKGKAPDGSATTSQPDTTDTPVVTAAPALTIDKTAMLDDADDNGAADQGEVVTYSFAITNTGNVTVSGVRVVDALPGLVWGANGGVTLAPGASVVRTATYVVTQADVDAGGTIHNTATAQGRAPGEEPVTSTPDTTDTNLVPGAPGIALDKKAVLDDVNDNGKADVGEEIAYTFEVTNTGNVTASDVSVTDPRVQGITPATATVTPGDTVTFTADPYVVTQDDVDAGVVHNVAAATATVPGGDVVRSEDVADVETIDAQADLSIVKSAAITVDGHVAGKADVGDVLTYTFTVRNDGKATAFDVTVSDLLSGLSAISPTGVAHIAPGAEAVFTATYAVTRADVKRGRIDNIASVSFRGPIRGGEAPAPVSVDSNPVTTPTGGLGAPVITTRASSAKVATTVSKAGTPNPVRLHDVVTISGFVTGGDATGTATLYGPVERRSAAMCTPANKVATVSFAPRNGTFRAPSMAVSEPGYYTWVVSTGEDRRNDAASHGCGVAAETTLVHRAEVGKIRIETGPTGRLRVHGRQARPAQVAIPAIGMRAALDPVGVRHRSMVIPENVRRGGWLTGSALPGEKVGATVIAGHVSDRHDRRGAFGKLTRAEVGQIVTVRGGDGKVQQYRITRIYQQSRTRGFAGGPIATAGPHQLTLVTCTGKVSYPNGRFHYTRNLVVIATPIG